MTHYLNLIKQRLVVKYKCKYSRTCTHITSASVFGSIPEVYNILWESIWLIFVTHSSDYEPL